MTQTTLIGRLLLGALYTSIAVAVVATAMLTVSGETAHSPKVLIGGEEIMVMIADTAELQKRGLSGHAELKPNEGMLFVFPQPGFYGFWMKDMFFPIDIIWFDEKRQIVDVWEKATPNSYPKRFTPQGEAMYVLEVKAGFYDAYHLRIGDKMSYTLYRK